MATDHNFKVKKGIHVLGSEGIYLTDTNTRLHEGSGNALRISTGTGNIDIGSMNSGWVHMQANKNIYILPNVSNGYVAIDGDLQPYTDSTRTLGTSGTRWSHIYGDALTIGGAISSGKIEGTTADANGHILKTDSSTATASDVALQITNSSSDYYLKFQPRLPAGNMHAGVNTDDFGIFTSNSKGISIGNNDKSLVIIHPTDGLELWTNNARRFNIDTSGNIQVNGTTIIDTSRNLTNIGTIASKHITLSVPDEGSAPAMSATLNIYGYEGRGAGIKIRDSQNSASNANSREWFIGSGYAQSGFNIGYASDGSQSSYTAQNKFSISTAGHASFAGNITATGTLTTTTINTGQGDTEVYLMNQNVRSSDSPTFQDLTIQGNLSITGDINSYNVTDLDVVDKTITLGVGGTASANDGGGIIVDGADAKLTWNNTNSYWQMNKQLAFNATATTTNQQLGIVWSGFDKEATSDYSDRASIIHTVNTGGHAGSVLVFTAENDSNDGIAFTTNASSSLKHNSSNILTAANFASNITSVLPLAGGTITGTVVFNSAPTFNTAITMGSTLNVATSIGIAGTTVINAQKKVQNVTLDSGTTGARFQVGAWHYDTNNDARFYFEANGRTYYRSDTGHHFRANGDTTRLTISQSGGINLFSAGDTQAGTGEVINVAGTNVLDSNRNLSNIGTISGTGISTGANLVDLFANQNGTNELRLDNNRQDLSNVPVSKVSGRNSVEVANMTFYRGGGGNSGFIRFQNKPTNAASLTDVFQVGDGGTVGYGVDILAGGLRIGGTRKDGNWDTAYGWGNHASAGYITSSTGTLDSLRIASGGTTSDTQEGKEYKYYLVGMGLTDGNWKKVCDVTVGTGLYKALTMNITLESQNSNFGSANTTQTSKFSATYYRSAGTQDDVNNATISGHNTDNHELRILKTATGVYQLQIKMLNAYKDAIVKIEVLSTNSGSVSVPSSITNGSTTGTAYTPSTSTSVKNLYNTIKTFSTNSQQIHNTGVIYLGSTATANDQFATNNGTDIFIGTTSKGLRTYKDLHTNSGNYKYWHEGNDGPSSGLNADKLDNQEGSYYTNASNLSSGYVPSARLSTGTSGDWWAGNVVKVGTDGVMEVGKYIDFHNTDAGTSDFDTRLESTGSNELTINGVGRILTTADEGTGNGIDADTVDGVEASRIIFGSNSSGTNEGTVTNWNSITKSGFYSDDNASNKWTTSNWSSVLHHKLYDNNNNYASQLGFDTYAPDLYYRMSNNGTWTDWYEIYHEGHKPTYSELGTMAYSNLTGTPTIPSLSGYATETYVGTQITNLIDGAPGTLNTLNELAAAVADNNTFFSTVLPKSGGTMTGALAIDAGGNAITISSGAPQMRFNDTSSGADDFWIHVNSDRFYILADRGDDNAWEVPYPLELNASSNIGYVFSHRLFTEAYHPNADKWTTARTLSLSNHATGSVSWDGSANATLSVTVTGGDSDTLDGHDHTSFEPHGTLSVSSDYQYGNAASSLYTNFTRSSATTDTDQHGRHYYSGTGQHRTKFIPIDKTASYRMKIRWKTSAAKPTYIAVFLLDTSGSNITGSGTYWRYPWSGTNSPTSWTTNEYVYHANEMPSNAAYIAFGISHTNYGTSGATYYVSELELEKNNSVEYSAAGGVSQYYTSSRNLRGYIGATETDDGHFVIATSGNEDIAFKDGGISGTTNMVVRGDGNVYILGSIVNGTIPYSQVTSAPTIPTNNNQLTNGASYTTDLGFARYNTNTSYSTYSNRQIFYSNTNMATSSSYQASLEVFASGTGNDAFMSFHVGGDYALYLGLDGGTNKLSVGGWSAGASSNAIYHEGNKPTLSELGYTGATDANKYVLPSTVLHSNAYKMTSSAFKLGFHSGSGGTTFSNNHYSMGVDVANGAWSNPNYSDLIIGYHTGIRIGGGYSGVRFYNNSPTTDTNNDGNGEGNESLLMTVGGGGAATSGAHVTVENDLIADSIRSDNYQDNAGTFLFKKGSGTGTTRHLNLANTTADPASVTSSNNPTGISWGQRSDNGAYYMLGLKGQYNNGFSNHSRLAIAWHTGIEIGANASYGGVRFMEDTPFLNTTEIFGIGVISGGHSRIGSNKKLYFNSNTTYGIGAGGHNYNSGYFDTLESGTSTDPLELVYYQGNRVNIGSGGGTKPLGCSQVIFGNTTSRSISHGVGYSSANAVKITGNWNEFEVMGRVLDVTGSNCHFMDGYGSTNHASHYLSIGTNSGGNGGLNYMIVGTTLRVSGDVIAYYSDGRLKQNVKEIPNALDIVKNIRGVTYEWNKLSESVWSKKEGDEDFGLISQEVEAVFPMGVVVQGGTDVNKEMGYADPESENYDPLHDGTKDEVDYKTVRYDKMVAVAIQAIKEQQVMIEELQKEIKELKRGK